MPGCRRTSRRIAGSARCPRTPQSDSAHRPSRQSVGSAQRCRAASRGLPPAADRQLAIGAGPRRSSALPRALLRTSRCRRALAGRGTRCGWPRSPGRACQYRQWQSCTGLRVATACSPGRWPEIRRKCEAARPASRARTGIASRPATASPPGRERSRYTVPQQLRRAVPWPRRPETAFCRPRRCRCCF